MNSPSSDQLDVVEQEIYGYLNPDNFKSFFLFAGAGSGKTRTLVNVLEKIRNNYAQRFLRSGQQVAVITFTNAACDEIKDRLEHDPVFPVSTIHSFSWRLIKPFTEDIRSWLKGKLSLDIDELNDKINRARDKQGKTAQKNIRRRDKKKSRLKNIDKVSGFLYSPDSSNTKKGSLQHDEVVSLAAYFLNKEPLMQKILVNRYPVLLIDESQDTTKDLLDALVIIQQNFPDRFCLGLFGDTMQRIYGGGKPDLDTTLPPDWAKPAKKINHRSPKRVIELINRIRLVDDKHQQKPREDASEGIVRLFIVDARKISDKFSVERSIRDKMAENTEDELWRTPEKVKTLILEHHMAAQRGGFADFFLPFLGVDTLKDAALKGHSSEMKFLKNQLVPLWQAIQSQDDFAVANVMRDHSPLLSSSCLEEHPEPMSKIRHVNVSVEKLCKLITEFSGISLLDLLQAVSERGIFVIPDTFFPHLSIQKTKKNTEPEKNAMLEDDKSKAWGEALKAPFKQVVRYTEYIDEKLSFGTHQGVKGREFERVMVILDDKESRGWTFNYEKILGAEPPSGKDRQKEASGKESVLKTTRRLFYVTCSRAEKSLAVVAYTKSPGAVKEYVIQADWFQHDEIVLF